MRWPSRQTWRWRLRHLTLRGRLVTVLVALTTLALIATTAVTALLTRDDLMNRVDADLRAAAQPAATLALRAIANQDQLPEVLSNYAIVFMPVNGSPQQYSNPAGMTARPAIPPLAVDDPRVISGTPFTVPSIDGDTDWRVIAGRVRGDVATYAVAVPLSNVAHSIRQLVVRAVLIGLVVLAAVAMIGWYLVRRSFRPLSQIEDTAREIAAGDLTQRVPVPVVEDEVASLARSVNGMLGRIEESFAMRERSQERMRQFVADASHELRTPLATVRGYAELYRQGAVRDAEDVSGAMARIEGEATRMARLVDDLLTLARLDEHPEMTTGPVDLVVLAGDIAQDARARAPQRQIRVVAADGAPLRPVVVDGVDAQLRQVLTNLVSNAMQYTPQGSPIEVAVGSADAGTPASRALLEVRDHGPGIDQASAAKVFERFYRADKARSRASGGTGLGLAIVAAIVAAHDGRVGLAATPGGGATFVVELPTAKSQDSLTEH